MEGGKKSDSLVPLEVFRANGPAPGASISGRLEAKKATPGALISQRLEAILYAPIEVTPVESNPSSATEKHDSDSNSLRGEDNSRTSEVKNSFFYSTEEHLMPHPYSSSIFYGGQDFYCFEPQSTQYKLKKDGEKFSALDSSLNWWKGYP